MVIALLYLNGKTLGVTADRKEKGQPSFPDGSFHQSPPFNIPQGDKDKYREKVKLEFSLLHSFGIRTVFVCITG